MITIIVESFFTYLSSFIYGFVFKEEIMRESINAKNLIENVENCEDSSSDQEYIDVKIWLSDFL